MIFTAIEPIEFEKVPRYKPDYKHVKCNCGGIIGIYDRYWEACICDTCGKEYRLSKISYDYLEINDKTGWIFPVKLRTKWRE